MPIDFRAAWLQAKRMEPQEVCAAVVVGLALLAVLVEIVRWLATP